MHATIESLASQPSLAWPVSHRKYLALTVLYVCCPDQDIDHTYSLIQYLSKLQLRAVALLNISFPYWDYLPVWNKQKKAEKRDANCFVSNRGKNQTCLRNQKNTAGIKWVD